MSETLISSLTLESLRDLIQQAGYRAELVNDPAAGIQYLRSATGGIGYDIRPGNQLQGTASHFIDVALVAVLLVDGALPPDLINRWNSRCRFGRLQLKPPHLALSLDVSVMGGVTQAHVRAQIELWDLLVQQLLPFLRSAFAEAGVQDHKVLVPAEPAPAAAAE